MVTIAWHSNGIHLAAVPVGSRRAANFESSALRQVFGIPLAHLWPAFMQEVAFRSIVTSLRLNPVFGIERETKVT